MTVSIQQAACNALAAYLSTALTGVTVEARWPDARKRLPGKAVTITLAGPRQDIPIDERILSSTNVSTAQASSVWQIKFCQQPIQLDVWAYNDIDRDDIIAQLDIVLNAGASVIDTYANPVGHGVILATLSGDNWANTFCDYTFDSPEIHDEPDTVNECLYRATYQGDTYVMLSVTKTTARQVSIAFKQRLSETPTNPGDPYDITTITSSGVTYSTGP